MSSTASDVVDKIRDTPHDVLVQVVGLTVICALSGVVYWLHWAWLTGAVLAMCFWVGVFVNDYIWRRRIKSGITVALDTDKKDDKAREGYI